jgi:hypothetical protein
MGLRKWSLFERRPDYRGQAEWKLPNWKLGVLNRVLAEVPLNRVLAEVPLYFSCLRCLSDRGSTVLLLPELGVILTVVPLYISCLRCLPRSGSTVL